MLPGLVSQTRLACRSLLGYGHRVARRVTFLPDKRTGTVLLVRCAYVFVVWLNEPDDNLLRIQANVWLKILIKLIEIP